MGYSAQIRAEFKEFQRAFAAITDEPEPEVAAVGHDRTIINIKPEYVDAWLNPDPSNLGALYAIFDDKRHPFYEHRLAA